MTFRDISDQLSLKSYLEKKIEPWILNRFYFEKLSNRKPKKPQDIFNSYNRTVFDNLKPLFSKSEIVDDFTKNIKLFAFEDFPEAGSKLIRFFMVYATPELRRRYEENNQLKIPIHIFFHAVAEIYQKEKDYYVNGKIGDYYKNVGINYVINNQKLAIQHRYAIKHKEHLSSVENIPSLLIFPIFSGTSYTSYPIYKVNSRTKISFFSIIESLVKKIFPSPDFNNNIEYTCLGSFSRGSDRIMNTFISGESKWIDSFYLFDPVEFNIKTVEEWLKKENTSFKIYSAKKDFYSLEIEKIRKSGGKLFKQELEQFNNTIKLDHDSVQDCKCITNKYSGLINPSEIYSLDNKKYFFIFPTSNFISYLGDTKNCCGLNLGYGHAWFVENLVTHALANSRFP